jgi:23S rRNA pseudouridine2604 synthase
LGSLGDRLCRRDSYELRREHLAGAGDKPFSERFTEPECFAKPGRFAKPERLTQPKCFTEPERFAQPKHFTESERFAQPRRFTEPERFAQPRRFTEPERFTKSHSSASVQPNRKRQHDCRQWFV